MNKRLPTRDLIKRIKPELSNLPIVGASISMELNQSVMLTVNFIVTDDLIEAMSDKDRLLNTNEPPIAPKPPNSRIISEDKRDQLIDKN